MNYSTSLDYINSFINFEKIPRYSYASSFRLERMYAFLQGLGNPHLGLNVIHVAGSKGKGSTCSIIASILRQAGYRVGLYTSPHLLDERERIRVLNKVIGERCKVEGEFGGMIERDEFIELIEKIKPVAEKFRGHGKFGTHPNFRARKIREKLGCVPNLGELSFFEIFTACAFLYFKEKNVDFAILETGLGGRLDATNVTEALVYGITNISLEHTDKLGNSLESIAREKAGIIKVHSSQLTVDSVVVTVSQEKEVMDVLTDVCNEKKVDLYEIGKDITYSVISSDEKGQVFDLDGLGYSYKDLEVNLIGRHQVENASLAIAMVKALFSSCCRAGLNLPYSRGELREDAIRSGLKNIFWPGRLQVIQKQPYVVLDGAQNPDSIKKVISSIEKIFNYNRLISVFGISRDKDIEGVSKELDRSSDVVILTKSSNERAKEPIYLKENFSCKNLRLSSNVKEALNIGLEMATKKDLILVTGSLYVVGEAIRNTKQVGHI
ncbi:MAG: bifunctional folylpolyglutamate synthase/dihydrofolate synthase [Candidatus Omnitrophica bacterium]|nr:bifunctional folylpolyglutamate synthase/dihydrofolate synthase [Candidatus Omnitrophota bacterium]